MTTETATGAPSFSEGGAPACSKCKSRPRAPRGSWCRECRREAQRAYNTRTRPRPVKKHGICEVCGAEMEWLSGHGPDRVHCSKACKMKADTAVQRQRRLETDAAYAERLAVRQEREAHLRQGRRRCNRCQAIKPLGEFHVKGAGRQYTCAVCAHERGRLDDEIGKQRRRSWRSHLMRKYKLTLEAFDRLLAAQQGRCKICVTPMTEPHVDHDHACCPSGTLTCGQCIRGLLCSNCNVGLGAFADDIERLKAAVLYLELDRAA